MSFKTLLIAAVGASCLAAPAMAQSYPDRPVSIIVGNNPGGSIDGMARRVAEALSAAWGQPVVIENRAGADGTVAATLVADAPADGYTLLFVSNGFSLSPLQMDSPYDPVESFTPIMQIAQMPLVLAANPDAGIGDAAGLLSLATEKPGTLNGGASGSANATFNAMNQLVTQTGSDIEIIPYTGAAAMMTALLAGEVQIGFSGLAGISPQLVTEGGTLIPLAVTATERAARLPEVPTVKEAFGLDNFELWSAWYGILAPAGLDPAVLEKISADLRTAIESEPLKTQLANEGLTVIASTPEGFKATLIGHGEIYPELLGLPKKD